MKRQSESEHENENALFVGWTRLYQEGALLWPPTECSRQCVAYARLNHRRVFLSEIQPEGPWHCQECNKQLRRNEVVVDHIDHIHNGFGSHNCPENLRPLCGKCNHKLSKKVLAATQAILSEASKEWARRTGDALRRWWASLTDEERALKAQAFSDAQLRRWATKTQRERTANTAAAREAAQRPEAKEQQRQGLRKRQRAGLHGRLHVQRGVVDEACEFCSRDSRK